MNIEVIEADITTLTLDAIVNAAAPALLGGGGVDGAIHRAAGPGLLAACRALPEVAPGVRCPTGEAEKLASCYRQSLLLGLDLDVGSMAFPAISCGVYGYPIEAAADVAVGSIRGMAQAVGSMQIVLCCFGEATAGALRRALAV
jgi:O-acetyl-ADP-ribose deacetylase (regulator of RNase III)